MLKYLPLPLIATLAITGCSTIHNIGESTAYQYGTKSVYSPKEDMSSYQKVPSGYHLVYTEMLARHGSRALSSPKNDDISLKIWRKAQEENALTPMGEKLGPEIQRLMAANEAMGYGNLSWQGKQEHLQMGERLAIRDKVLWDEAIKQNKSISVEYSGKERAKDSALSFIQGLESNTPALTYLLSPPKKDKDQLYFHKSKDNQYYQEYKEDNPMLRESIDQLFDQPKSHDIARDVLERIYTPSFVDQLAKGELSFVRQGKKKAHVYNDIDAVIQLFNLYLIAPGLAHEAGTTPWQFKQYFTPSETQWLSYLLDAEDFYEKGPSFDDTDITYRMAKVLEDDFFNEVHGIENGTNAKAAKLRFAHAETIIPLAAIMQLPGSEQGVSHDTAYTQSTNDWRGSWVSPYSANIQWDIYKNQSGDLLVRMLYNEKETSFKEACAPIQPKSYFYDFDELSKCYGE